MFVRCSNCQTQFSLDERQIGADGVAVRCAVCRYVFRVDLPDGTASAGWRVQTVDGDLFEADDLTTMRVWVREGRLHPDDTISRTGKHWIRLGDMPEFSDAFAGFPDLPVVLGVPESAALEASEFSAVGPPPSFAGDEVADAVQPVSRAPSERLDMSGVFAMPEEDDTVVHGRAPGATEDTVSVGGPGVVSRTSLFEDSASMVLDDLVAPTPEEPPPEVSQRRKPKHQTTKVRTVAAVEDADPEASGVVRVLDDVEALEAEGAADPDAPLPRSESSDRKPVASGSMLGAVTAHVKSDPVKPLTGPQSEVEPAPEREPDSHSAELELEQAEPVAVPPRRSTWPLFAGLGLLCGAAVVFGIPQVRERVLGPSGSPAASQAPAAPPALAQVDAAVAAGTQAELRTAADAAHAAAEDTSLDAGNRADLLLASAEARAAESVALRLEALHSREAQAVGFRADDAAEAAGQTFAGVDVQAATPDRVARTRARVHLAQGRPSQDVLPDVPDDAPELRALVLGSPLWTDAEAAVPSGLITGLTGLSEPSVLAQVLLATAYARSGDDEAATRTRAALNARAADDATVAALLAGSGPKVAAEATNEDSGKTPSAPETPTPEQPSEPEETIVVKDAPKAVSTDTLIDRGCAKVEGGDVSGGLKMLLKAFDRRPNDIDVLVCLGTANRKKGTPSTALRYYERALGRSPKFLPALLGAARASSKMGNSDKALGYYRRVLGVSPSNVEAKSYVAKKSGSAKKPTAPSQTDSGSAPAGGTKKPAPPTKKPEPPSPDRKPEPPKPAP